MRTLYGYPASANTHRARLALSLLALPFDEVLVDLAVGVSARERVGRPVQSTTEVHPDARRGGCGGGLNITAPRPRPTVRPSAVW